MGEEGHCCVLTLNSGSSSIKSAVYQMKPAEKLLFSGNVERIGLDGGRILLRDAEGNKLAEQRRDFADHDAAIGALLDLIVPRLDGRPLWAVGHRLVHGGPDCTEPRLITAALLETLELLRPLAPDHLPHELGVIRAVAARFPALEQVACFDTAFHRDMPEVAQRFALPHDLWQQGVRRYGFHGLSYEYIMHKLAEVAGEEAAKGRVIVAHLGNGASMAAVRGGKCVDTTMGLTPAGGLMMGTRCGDLDPGVLLYLLREKGLSVVALDDLVNQRSGLLGVSGSSSDMQDLLRRESDDRHAAEAIELFCRQAKKYLGALAAVLGGIDTLVFTAGIGARSPEIRWRICQRMEFLGLRLDPARNQANAPIISGEGAVTIRVIETSEELMIARHTCDVLNEAGLKKN